MLHYKSLTKRQRKFICNGCGGKGGFVNPPEFLFHASCNHHDFLYWRGGTEEDRENADNAFYDFMKKDIAEAKWYKRTYYSVLAFTYFKAVRKFGEEFFFYASRCKNEKDLQREMRRTYGTKS